MPNLPDISGLISGFTSLADGVSLFLLALAAVVGLAFYVHAGIMMVRASSGREQIEWSRIGGSLLIGTFLLQFARSVNNTTEVVTGAGVTAYSSAMSYIPIANQSSFWQSVLLACLAWVSAMGWAGCFRGLLLWKAATNGKSSRGDEFWRGATHLIGGAGAINIAVLLQHIFS
jgi:hypothetical protein